MRRCLRGDILTALLSIIFMSQLGACYAPTIAPSEFKNGDLFDQEIFAMRPLAQGVRNALLARLAPAHTEGQFTALMSSLSIECQRHRVIECTYERIVTIEDAEYLRIYVKKIGRRHFVFRITRSRFGRNVELKVYVLSFDSVSVGEGKFERTGTHTPEIQCASS